VCDVCSVIIFVLAYFEFLLIFYVVVSYKWCPCALFWNYRNLRKRSVRLFFNSQQYSPTKWTVLFTPCTVDINSQQYSPTKYTVFFTPCTVDINSQQYSPTKYTVLFTPCTVDINSQQYSPTKCTILFTPCTVDINSQQYSPTKYTVIFPDVLNYSITLNTATCFALVYQDTLYNKQLHFNCLTFVTSFCCVHG
jgi:hypothetical protein